MEQSRPPAAGPRRGVDDPHRFDAKSRHAAKPSLAVCRSYVESPSVASPSSAVTDRPSRACCDRRARLHALHVPGVPSAQRRAPRRRRVRGRGRACAEASTPRKSRPRRGDFTTSAQPADATRRCRDLPSSTTLVRVFRTRGLADDKTARGSVTPRSGSIALSKETPRCGRRPASTWVATESAGLAGAPLSWPGWRADASPSQRSPRAPKQRTKAVRTLVRSQARSAQCARG